MIDSIYNWLVANVPPWFWIALIAHGAIMGTVAPHDITRMSVCSSRGVNSGGRPIPISSS